MKTILYCGGFPPPYGGVTVKNSLLADALEEKGYHVCRQDTRHGRKNPLLLLKQTRKLLLTRGTIVVAASREGRRKLIMLLSRLRPQALSRTLVVVMGGSMPGEIAGDMAYLSALRRCRRLLVETESMGQAMEAMGLTNVSVYPNCRPDHRVSGIRPTGSALRCLFFSQISREKGVDLILSSAAALPDTEFHFYGPVENDFASHFHKTVDTLPNCAYHGIFPGSDPALYPLLHTYDLLLLPTRHTTEGVPGILVESKLAALPALVTDVSRNRELIADGVNGVLLKNPSAQALTEALTALSADPGLVDRMKAAALNDAAQYLLPHYLPMVESLL